MCAQASYAAQLLYRDNSLRLYQPFPSGSSATLHQPHHPPTGTDQRPSGLVSTAVRALRMDFSKEGGYQYKKAGVIVWNIVPDSAIQTNLFDTIDRDKQSCLAAAIDTINRKNGHNTIKVAVQDTTDKSWHLKCEHISKQYTTNLDDVILVK